MNSKHADRWEELRKVNPNLARIEFEEVNENES